MTPLDRAVAAVVQTPADIMFPLPLDVRYIDGHTWEIRADFCVVSPAPDVFPSVWVPAGRITDFASIPRLFWRELYPADPHIAKAAVWHDELYKNPKIPVTREHADMALRAGMEALGSPLWERSTCYALIRLFGHGFLPREQ